MMNLKNEREGDAGDIWETPISILCSRQRLLHDRWAKFGLSFRLVSSRNQRKLGEEILLTEQQNTITFVNTTYNTYW